MSFAVCLATQRAPALGLAESSRLLAERRTLRTRRLRCEAAKQKQDPAEAREDFLSGKSFSREVLTTYEISNEGGGFGPTLFATGGLAVGLLAALPSSIGDCVRAAASVEQPLAILAANIGAIFVSLALVKGQVGNRTRKLEQLARELVLGDLRVVTIDRLGNERFCNLRELRRSRRVALIYGSREKLLDDIAAAQVYRRRLASSSIVVVPILTDGSEGPSVAARVSPPSGRTLYPNSYEKWLAWPTEVKGGFDAAQYFEELLSSNGPSTSQSGDGAYITLGIDGRVRGSGEESPFWDVLLSTFPQQAITNEGKEVTGTTAKTPEQMSDDPDIKSIVALHNRFYQALDQGNTNTMASLWSSPDAISSAVSDYSSRGAALDGWDVVLREDRRPIGMTVSDVDVTVDPCRTRATLTCIETVSGGTTLLATQTFQRKQDGDAEWSFIGHKTIPYGREIVAKIVLQCDGRGCVALPAKAVASSASASRFQLK